MSGGVYIHVPFCAKKCDYCDFTSQESVKSAVRDFLTSLELEIKMKAGSLKNLDTLYIGGGTPSVLSAGEINFVFRTVGNFIRPVPEFREITFEANPESLSREKTAILKKSGVTRLSLGLQSASDASLERLGRISRVADFTRAWNLASEARFDSVNVDVILGIPGESAGDFSATLDFVLKRRPEHISVYSLEVRRGTPFSARGVRIDGDLCRMMYDRARKILKKNGYRHYEISNFALAGRQSLHNLNYWNDGEYLGFGPSAVSHLGGKRTANVKRLRVYVEKLKKSSLPISFSERLEGKEKLGEKIMLGLRKTDGIELGEDIFIKFNKEIAKLLNSRLVEIKNGRLKIKEKHLYVSNAVFSEFV